MPIPDAAQATPAPRVVSGERVRTICLLVLAVCVGATALQHLGGILAPLFIALFLFYVFKPIAETLRGWKVPRWIVYPGLLLFVLVSIPLLGQIISSDLGAFQARLPRYQERLNTWLDAVARLTGYANEEGRFDWNKYSPAEIIHFSWNDAMRLLFGTTLEFLGTSLLVAFYFLFLLLDARKLPRRIRQHFPPGLAESYLQIGERIDSGIKRYVGLKTLVSLGLGLSTGLLAWLFGLDFCLFWTVAMFLANYVTYIGSAVVCLPLIALAFLQFSTPWAAIGFAVLVFLNRTVWIDYVEIAFLGKRLNISPVILLLAIAIFGYLWGLVGMVLAVPLVTLAKIVLANFQGTAHLAHLISEE
jgi:AI-2 transport protein TqsA